MSVGRSVKMWNRPRRRHQLLLHHQSAGSVNLDFDFSHPHPPHPSCRHDDGLLHSLTSSHPAPVPPRRASSVAGTAAGRRSEDAVGTAAAAAAAVDRCCERPGTGDTSRTDPPPGCRSVVARSGPRTAGGDETSLELGTSEPPSPPHRSCLETCAPIHVEIPFSTHDKAHLKFSESSYIVTTVTCS